jgi:nitrate reductase gamma subunit
MHYDTSVFIYLIAIGAIVILTFGIFDLTHIWKSGEEPTLNTGVSADNWIKHFLKSILFQKQIKENGIMPWITHLLIFYGFMSLLCLTTLQFFLTWLIPSNFSIVGYFKTGTGNYLMAVWGDMGGLALLAGTIIALYRRYISKPSNFYTIFDDSIAIWLLFSVTVSGFFCEILRLLARPDAQDAMYSFAVYWFAKMLSGIKISELDLSFMFYFHGILSLVFIAYIPFSKMRHIFVSPATYAFVTSSEPYTKS